MNKILKLSFQNRKYLALILLAGLCLSLIPLYFAGAEDAPDLAKCEWHSPFDCFGAVIHWLISLPIRLNAIGPALLLAIFAMVSGMGYILITIFLGWIKTIILNVPVIPSEVGVVRAGFDITRDLANILLILVLVFIGLATILRVKDYEAKKLLPILIIVALLVNFSPVLVGFVVDISNIVTNFFLNMGSFEHTISVFLMIGDYFGKVFSILTEFGEVWDIMGHIVGVIVLGIVLILFFTYASWIYLMIVRILIVRVIALWILMILAPIAFLFYILPATRGLATKWWQNLVQWAVLGIPIGFFLFLSFKILQDTTDINSMWHGANLSGNVESASYGAPWEFSKMNARLAESFGMMLAPLVSLIMLHIGYKLSRTYMPAIAQQMINKSEQMVKTGAKIAGMAALTIATAGAGAAIGSVAASAGAGLAKAGVGKGLLGKGMGFAGSKLIEYGEKTKKLSMPSGFKNWTASGQEAWIEARQLNNRELLVATDAAGSNQEHFSEPLRKRINKAVHAAYGLDKDAIDKGKIYNDNEIEQAKEDTDYVKEARQAAKYSPDELSEPLRLKMKISGKTGDDRNNALEAAREEIDNTVDFMKRNLSEDDLTLEAGIKLKYITRKDVKDDRANALNTAKQNLRPDRIKQYLRDTAAAANFVSEFKSADISNIIDTKNLATRTGIMLGNPANLQRIADEHGKKALEDVITGRGGLNDATNTYEKMISFAEASPRMFKGLFTLPALQYIDIEARKHMVDPEGRPTDNYKIFRKTLEMENKLASSSPELKRYYNLHKGASALQRRIETKQARGQSTKTEEAKLQTTFARIASGWDEIENNETWRKEWINIEKIRDPKRGETLQKNVEAELRVQGILNNNPDLLTYDRLNQKEIEYQQRIGKARRLGKNTDWLERQQAITSKRLITINQQILADDDLSEKWDEVEELRQAWKEPGSKPKRRSKP